MKGVAKAYKPGTVDSIAFMAGDDILVFSEDAAKGIEKIKMAVDSGRISPIEFEARVKKVLAYKYKLGSSKPYVPVRTDNLYSDLNNTKALALQHRLFEEAITIPANLDNRLPLRNWNYKRVASLSIGNHGETEFQQHISNYEEMDFFNLRPGLNREELGILSDTLATYDLVIVDLHGMTRQAAKNYSL